MTLSNVRKSHRSRIDTKPNVRGNKGGKGDPARVGEKKMMICGSFGSVAIQEPTRLWIATVSYQLFQIPSANRRLRIQISTYTTILLDNSVPCVEQHTWSYRSTNGNTSTRVITPSLVIEQHSTTHFAHISRLDM